MIILEEGWHCIVRPDKKHQSIPVPDLLHALLNNTMTDLLSSAVLSPIQSHLGALALTLSYVGSLYLTKPERSRPPSNANGTTPALDDVISQDFSGIQPITPTTQEPLNRDHPIVIKSRIRAVTAATMVGCVGVGLTVYTVLGFDHTSAVSLTYSSPLGLTDICTAHDIHQAPRLHPFPSVDPLLPPLHPRANPLHRTPLHDLPRPLSSLPTLRQKQPRLGICRTQRWDAGFPSCALGSAYGWRGGSRQCQGEEFGAATLDRVEELYCCESGFPRK
jgi:hypothetical protein